jgi:hypothetical protein
MSIDTQGRSHKPSGSATGGQFAVQSRSDNGVALTPSGGKAARVDEDAMDQIALTLGTAEEWDGSADYLEEFADQVAASGRPHPGDADPREYRAAIDDLQAARSGPASPATRQLDKLALLLGTNAEWDGADYLEAIADMVKASGRPHPGGSIDPGEYQLRITAQQVERGSIPPEDAAQAFTDVMSANIVEWADMGCVNTWTATPVQDASGAWSYSTIVTGAYVSPDGDNEYDESNAFDLAGTPGALALEHLARCSPAGADLAPITVTIPEGS